MKKKINTTGMKVHKISLILILMYISFLSFFPVSSIGLKNTKINSYKSIKMRNNVKDILKQKEEDRFSLNFYSKNDDTFNIRLKKIEEIIKNKNKNQEESPVKAVFINNEICNMSSIMNKIKEKTQNTILEVSFEKESIPLLNNISEENESKINNEVKSKENEERVNNVLKYKQKTKTRVLSQVLDESEITKMYICNDCLNTEKEIHKLENRLLVLKEDFEKINPQDDEEYNSFIDKLNILNFVKIDMAKVNDFISVMKKYECNGIEKLLKSYQDIETYLINLLNFIQKKIENLKNIKIVILN